MIKRLMRSWDQLARTDPHWAVLTADDKAGGRWDEAAFFATGEADVAGVLERLAHLGIAVERTRALDFGCGLGRLTRALGRHFAAVDGVDISAVMVEQARARCTLANVRFVHNPAPDLRSLSPRSYALVLSLITLQHMPEAVALRYLDGLCGLLAPGGVAYVQLGTFLAVADPAARAKLARDESTTNRLYRRLRNLFRRPLRMDTHYCRLSRVLAVLERRRMEVCTVLPDASLPPPFVSHVVVFRRPG